jgi:large subunit ribosomal protein L3
MRRYGFRGGPSDEYGSTKFHRKRGSVGSGRKHKILPGTRMAGFMGNKLVMMKGLKVWRINTKYNVLYLMGPAVPGPNHGYMRIQDSTLYERKQNFTEKDHPPFPTYYPDDNNGKPLEEELFADDIYRFDQPTLTLDDVQIAPLTTRRTVAKTAQKKK